VSGQPSVIGIVAVVLIFLATGLLAAVETVVSRMNVVRALRLVEEEEEGDQAARATALLWLTEHRAGALDALLVATVIARVSLATLITVLVLAATSAWWWVLGAAALTIALSLVVTEVVPRTVVLRHLDTAGLLLARPGRLLVRLFGPVSTASVALGRALVPRRHEVSGPHAGDDELRALNDEAEEDDDELEPEERAMIRSIFELGETLVREVMVPRPDVISVPEDAPIGEVVGVAVDGGYSRLPVHASGAVDQIVGIVYAKDLLRRLATQPQLDGWSDLTRPPTFVPETKRCDELLRELQADAVHLALVIDEYGDFVGLVTIEDVLEEIVGEIVDEHDQEQELVESLGDGRFRIDARLGVDDLNELLGTELPEEGWDTVGGLVFGTLGRVPRAGERVELDRTTIEVEVLQGRRVAKVVVAVTSTEEAAGAELAGMSSDTATDEADGDAARQREGAARADGARGPNDRGPAAAHRDSSTS
jgi:CBS domain containing-hemolysin-like protein